MEKLGRILMVEDDPKDVELSLTALEDYNLANEVVVAREEFAEETVFFDGEAMVRREREDVVVGVEEAASHEERTVR